MRDGWWRDSLFLEFQCHAQILHRTFQRIFLVRRFCSKKEDFPMDIPLSYFDFVLSEKGAEIFFSISRITQKWRRNSVCFWSLHWSDGVLTTVLLIWRQNIKKTKNTKKDTKTGEEWNDFKLQFFSVTFFDVKCLILNQVVCGLN